MAEREAQTPEQRAALAAVLLNEAAIHAATTQMVAAALDMLKRGLLQRDLATLTRHIDVAKKQHEAALDDYRRAMGGRA